MSYSCKKRWLPVTLYYSYLLVIILGIVAALYGIATGQLGSFSNGFCFKNILLAFVCIALFFNASMLIKTKRVVSANREESSRNNEKEVVSKPQEFKNTTIESFKLLGGLLILLFCVSSGILSVFHGESVSSNILFFGLFLFFGGTLLNVILIFIFFYEESYCLNEEGFCFEQRKLFWKKTRKCTPLNSINQFLLKSRVFYDTADLATVYYFVNVITQDEPVTILQYTESEKHIPEWFVSSGNQVLANLTGRELNVTIAPSEAPNSTISDKSSDLSENPIDLESQNDNQLSALCNNNPGNTLPVPPNCELGEDHLSFSYQASAIVQIIFGILFVGTATASICLFFGVFPTDNHSVAFSLAVVSFFLLFSFLNNFKRKVTGRLDENGFHFDEQSLFRHSTKNIPLDSICSFRRGTQEVQSDEDTSINTINTFVEIVTTKELFRILENNGTDRLCEWLVDSGNALLPNLKKKAAEAQ